MSLWGVFMDSLYSCALGALRIPSRDRHCWGALIPNFYPCRSSAMRIPLRDRNCGVLSWPTCSGASSAVRISLRDRHCGVLRCKFLPRYVECREDLVGDRHCGVLRLQISTPVRRVPRGSCSVTPVEFALCHVTCSTASVLCLQVPDELTIRGSRFT